MLRIRRVISAALLGALAGCTSIVDETVDNRFDSIDRSAGKARNESVLRNIARASEKIPLTFLAFQRVGGSLQTGVAGGLPAFSLGPHTASNVVQRDVSVSNTTLSGTVATASTVDLTVLESSEFYHALTDPGDLIDTWRFIQDYPRELIFWLFLDSVQVTLRDGKKVQYLQLLNRPDPRDSCRYLPMYREYLCFRHLVELAMLTGINVQVTLEEGELRSRGRHGNSSRRDTARAGDSERRDNERRRRIYARLCLDPFLSAQTQQVIDDVRKDYQPTRVQQDMIRAVKETPSNRTADCRKPFDEASKNQQRLILKASPLRGRSFEYELKTRSTFGIYQFLGRILHENAMEQMRVTGLEPDTVTSPKILAVEVDGTRRCVVSTNLRDRFYCVTDEGSQLTRLVFNLLNQLIALKTQSQDVGIVPTVRVSP